MSVRMYTYVRATILLVSKRPGKNRRRFVRVNKAAALSDRPNPKFHPDPISHARSQQLGEWDNADCAGHNRVAIRLRAQQWAKGFEIRESHTRERLSFFSSRIIGE